MADQSSSWPDIDPDRTGPDGVTRLVQVWVIDCSAELAKNGPNCGSQRPQPATAPGASDV